MMSYNGRSWTLQRAKTTICPSDWRWDSASPAQHWWGTLQLWVVSSGRGFLKVAGQKYPLARGAAFILHAHQRHLGSHEPSAPLTVHAVTFDHVESDGSVHIPAHNEYPLALRFDRFGFFETLCRRVIAEWRSNQRQLAQAWLCAAQAEIIREGLMDEKSSAACPDPRRRVVAEILDAMYQSPHHEWSLPRIARLLSLSETQARRVFTRFSGYSPREARIRARVEAAEELLAHTELSLQQIAARLGYCDQFAFSRQFQKIVGQAPSKYRQGPTAT